MELILYRNIEINNAVLGELYYNNKLICYTLEDKIRDIKIKHETCIPEGIYKVILNLSNRFKTILPLLLNVPNFEGIRIHSGSSIASTSGCIIVGTTINGDKLLHSKVALAKLLDEYLKPAFKRKEEIFIKIINPIKVLETLPQVQATILSKIKDTIILPKEVYIEREVTPQQASTFKETFKQIIQWLTKLFYKN